MDIQVEPAVTAVTVYPDRARVTARGRCELPVGLHRVLVGNLPLGLEAESLRAAGLGTARVRLRGVDLTQRFYDEAPSAAVQELEQQIESAGDELRVLSDSQATKRAQLEHINGMRAQTDEFARALARGKTTADAYARLLAMLQEQDEALRDDLRELDAGERSLRRHLETLEKKLAQLRAARPRQRSEAILEVEVLAAGDFEPEVSYVVYDAGWQPLYDIRLASGDGAAVPLTVIYLAQVRQATGQEWRGIQLTVSTARPALNQRMPELTPWYVDEARVQPRLMRAAAKNAVMSDVADEAYGGVAAGLEMAMAAPVMAEVVYAEARDSGTAVSYVVAGDVDIPSDGAPHKTTLSRFNLPAELDYLTAPRHTDAVYRRAKAANTANGPLLPGHANLFVGDEFIGQNEMAYTPTNGEIELFLGVEERIAVERELVRRDVDKRFLRDVRQIGYGYEVRLTNHLGRAAAVKVQDQIPVSRHDQIKVKLEKVAPPPAEQSELAILEWRLELAAGEKKTIRYEYSVEHPREMRVMGLAD